nr:DUF2515 family protein [Cytobacillus horneckiae]
MTIEEKTIIDNIRKKTAVLNKNNITRTKAYLDFYIQHPTMHWPLLAHMVSRNAGWNMTDLKGDLLSRLLTIDEQEMFFSFMERANWLIFQDAYPQLLLYEESVKRGEPLFYLLPYMDISIFMEVIWSLLWETDHSDLLTIALIINEQNYIENRVVRNAIYQKEVIHTIEFKLQDMFSFNYILFPYTNHSIVHFSGQVVHLFDELKERILLGKKLYRLLFQNESTLRSIVKWAVNHEHTGSRKDYWPHIFNNVQEGYPNQPYHARLSKGKLKSGAKKIYSPSLVYAWENQIQPAAETGDWYRDAKIITDLIYRKENVDDKIKEKYCDSLEKLELAVVAKNIIF